MSADRLWIGVMKMTNRDAIEWIKDIQVWNWHKAQKYQRYYAEALDIAVKALEKQIPTSMDLEGDGYADGVMIYDTWICPNCGKHYELEYDDYDFCPNCGQALDWED